MEKALDVQIEEVAKVECNCPHCHVRLYLEFPLLGIRGKLEEVCGSCGKIFEINEEDRT